MLKFKFTLLSHLIKRLFLRYHLLGSHQLLVKQLKPKSIIEIEQYQQISLINSAFMHDPHVHECITLKQSNAQLQAKYNKALKQMLHLIEVNKSLKQCLDQNAQNMDDYARQQTSSLKAAHQSQLAIYAKQLEEYKRLQKEAAVRVKQIQQQNRTKQQEITQLNQNNLRLSTKVNELQKDSIITKNSSHLDVEKNRQQKLKKEAVGVLQAARERAGLQRQIEELKEINKQLNIDLIQEKDKYRSQIFTKETQFIKSKESECAKLQTIESKYQLLETELTNYKNIEKYFEDQAKSILDEEHIFNSIREQITRINEDFNKYEMESSNLLLKKREEDAQRNRRIIELENQVIELRGIELKHLQFVKNNEALKHQLVHLKAVIKTIESEKLGLEERNHVLQALIITEKHRSNLGISEKVKQFETRMKLLIEEKPGEAELGYGIQEIIILKSYVRELSDILNQTKKREEHLIKKNERYKIKFVDAEKVFKDKLEQYKKKLANYDVLVNKLYRALEEKLKDKATAEMERQFNSAIGHYEQKMIMMSDEIISLRKKYEELLKHNNDQEKNSSLERQIEMYKEMITQLSLKVNTLEVQNNRMSSQKPEFKQYEMQIQLKDDMIGQLQQKVEGLTQTITDLKEKQNNMGDIVENYEKTIMFYKQELESKEKINQNLSRNSIDTASLIEKINYLEFELSKNRTKSLPIQQQYQPIQDSEINQLKEKIGWLERSIFQSEQKNNQIIQKFTIEVNDLNSHVIALRTDNLSLRNEVQSKQDNINELKHQLFNAELKSQKDRGSGSLSRHSIHQDTSNQKLLLIVVLMSAEIESLQLKNQELQAMYHEDLDKYRDALKQLEARQLELCNSLQLSSNEHLPDRQNSNLDKFSQQQISHLEEHSANDINWQGKPEQTTIRSYVQQNEATKLSFPTTKVVSSISISSQSPLRRDILIKKIA